MGSRLANHGQQVVAPEPLLELPGIRHPLPTKVVNEEEAGLGHWQEDGWAQENLPEDEITIRKAALRDGEET